MLGARSRIPVSVLCFGPTSERSPRCGRTLTTLTFKPSCRAARNVLRAKAEPVQRVWCETQLAWSSVTASVGTDFPPEPFVFSHNALERNSATH